MRWPAALLLFSVILAACGRSDASSSGSQPSPGPTPTARPAAAPRPPGPASPGSLQLSGGVRGFLSLLAVSCSHSGTDIEIAMRGRVENVLYGVEISAPRPGEYQFEPASAGPSVSVRLTSQPSAGSLVDRWSAGPGSQVGAGAVSISEGAGSIDADLQGLAGTSGSVHVQGSWTCG